MGEMGELREAIDCGLLAGHLRALADGKADRDAGLLRMAADRLSRSANEARWREAFVKALRQDGVTQGALDRAARLAGRAAGGAA